MSYSPPDPTSQIVETPVPEDWQRLPLWCREKDGRFPTNAGHLMFHFREARAMVDRELMEAIYVLLRVR